MSAKKKPALSKASIAKPKLSIKPVPDFFDKLGNKAYLLVAGLIVFISIIVFKDYFFYKVYFFKDVGCDSITALYPFMYHTADYIAKNGIPKWSFSLGMGQSLFPFFLRDPFDIFLYLAGKDHILYFTVYKEIAKILFGGIIFFYYLKTLKLSNYTSIIGSLLFAFCGFMIVGGGWYIFSWDAFNMALLLLAFELLFSKKQWYLFPIAVFFIGLSMPFNLYLDGLFLTCYAIVRHLQTEAFNFKKLGSLFLKMIALGVIGLLLSAPFLLENIVQLFESPRGSGNSSLVSSLSAMPLFSISDEKQLGTCIMRFFSSEMIGSGSDFKGWKNILEAPMFYCGLPCLLLIPQVFQSLDKRVKRVFIVFVAVWLLPVIFPYFRYAFWLFTGNYYRAYSFFVALIVLYYALQALEFILQQRKINKVVLIITLVILLVLINYPFFHRTDAVNSDVSLFVMVMLIVYGLILFFIPKQKNPVYLKWIFLIAVTCELIYLTGISVNDRDALTTLELTQKTGYNDYSVDAVNYIKQNDKSFYRIDKNYSSAPAIYSSLNDGMVQGYYGTSCYSSFNQGNYVNYLELMGLVDKSNEGNTRWIKGLLSHPILESENNVKYILTREMSTPLWRLCCDSLTQVGDVKILRNKFTLPLGYTYNYFMKESSFDSLSPKQKDFVSLKTCVINDNDVIKVNGLKEFQLKDTGSAIAFNNIVWNEEVKALKKDTLTINQFSQNYIAGKINASEDKMMYLSIPYDGGWNLKVDGQPTDKIILNGGMTGVMVKKGNHTIELKYELRFFNKGLLLLLVGILLYWGCWFVMRRTPKVIS